MDVINRLWSKIILPRNSDGTINFDECWEFNGSKDKDGYPKIEIGGKTKTATRVMYECYNGPIGPGLCACHTCDFPSCINPKHLFVGTHAQNMKDRSLKGREVRGNNIHTCKLTPKDVKDILQGIYDEKFDSAVDISGTYSVDPTTVLSMLRGKTWKYITHDFCKTLGCDLQTLYHKLVGNRSHSGLKLTDEQVFDIRRRFAAGETTMELVRKFNVTRYVIYNVTTRRTYDHLPDEQLTIV